MPGNIITPPLQRFWAKVQKSPDACWLWQGGKGHDGYGSFILAKNHHVIAHRWIYQQLYGEIAADMCVCHHCDIRLCVRPDHLWVGTRAENNQDCIRKGRVVHLSGEHVAPKNRARGERQGSAKLTADDIRQIRAMAQQGSTQRLLAKCFGVGKTAIGEIIRRENWRHVS